MVPSEKGNCSRYRSCALAFHKIAEYPWSSSMFRGSANGLCAYYNGQEGANPLKRIQRYHHLTYPCVAPIDGNQPN